MHKHSPLKNSLKLNLSPFYLNSTEFSKKVDSKKEDQNLCFIRIPLVRKNTDIELSLENLEEIERLKKKVLYIVTRNSRIESFIQICDQISQLDFEVPPHFFEKLRIRILRLLKKCSEDPSTNFYYYSILYNGAQKLNFLHLEHYNTLKRLKKRFEKFHVDVNQVLNLEVAEEVINPEMDRLIEESIQLGISGEAIDLLYFLKEQRDEYSSKLIDAEVEREVPGVQQSDDKGPFSILYGDQRLKEVFINANLKMDLRWVGIHISILDLYQISKIKYSEILNVIKLHHDKVKESNLPDLDIIEETKMKRIKFLIGTYTDTNKSKYDHIKAKKSTLQVRNLKDSLIKYRDKNSKVETEFENLEENFLLQITKTLCDFSWKLNERTDLFISIANSLKKVIFQGKGYSFYNTKLIDTISNHTINETTMQDEWVIFQDMKEMDQFQQLFRDISAQKDENDAQINLLRSIAVGITPKDSRNSEAAISDTSKLIFYDMLVKARTGVGLIRRQTLRNLKHPIDSNDNVFASYAPIQKLPQGIPILGYPFGILISSLIIKICKGSIKQRIDSVLVIYIPSNS